MQNYTDNVLRSTDRLPAVGVSVLVTSLDGKDVHDMLLNVFTMRSTTFNSPEAGLAAGIGSLYISLNTGQVPYIKSTGANTNTGWVAL